MGAPNCPTPSKKGYKTRAGAARHQWQLWRNSKRPDRINVRPYLCRCGLWHVGHSRARRKA